MSRVRIPSPALVFLPRFFMPHALRGGGRIRRAEEKSMPSHKAVRDGSLISSRDSDDLFVLHRTGIAALTWSLRQARAVSSCATARPG